MRQAEGDGKQCGQVVNCSGTKPCYTSLQAIPENRVYCSPACRDKWINENSRKICGEKIAAFNRRTAGARMRSNNPMHMPGVKEKMMAKLKGRTFLGRGGNGKTTNQQLALHALLPLMVMEYAIETASVAAQFECLPTTYKVDLADIETKLAVEVDGKSHKSRKWKFLDRRKTEVLNSLGWTVLRFWNGEVDSDIQKCAQMISSTISRLRGTTTISPTDSLSITVTSP